MKYILTVLDVTVHDWDSNNGEGAFINAFDLNIKSESFKELTADSIISILKKLIPVDNGLTATDLYIDEESSIGSLTQVENISGQPDATGNYLVDYTYKIERIELVNLLQVDGLSC